MFCFEVDVQLAIRNFQGWNGIFSQIKCLRKQICVYPPSVTHKWNTFHRDILIMSTCESRSGLRTEIICPWYPKFCKLIYYVVLGNSLRNTFAALNMIYQRQKVVCLKNCFLVFQNILPESRFRRYPYSFITVRISLQPYTLPYVSLDQLRLSSGFYSHGVIHAFDHVPYLKFA